MTKSALILGLIVAELAFASSARAEPAPLPPPWDGVYQPVGVDEIGWWREDDESERQLAASSLVIRDEELTNYVKRVLCDTVGDDRCEAVRVYIVREPTFNATMSPNGTMRVLSGLFLRVHSEAELAAVLGHEFGHFEKRHGVNKFRKMRSGSDLLAWGALLASMSSTRDTYQTFQDLELAVYGNLFRYNRDQEREADYLGLAYLNQSELKPQAASAVWENVMGEVTASANVRGLRKPKFNSIAFTASHPPHGERASYLADLAAPEGSFRDDGQSRYRAALSKWLPVFLDDQVKLNDFGASEYIIDRLAQDGWTADLWFARGELFRTRGNQRDLTHASTFYGNAVEANPKMAEAYRGLGLALFKTGRRTEGQEALAKYLELAPDASDVAMIKMMVPTSQGEIK